MTKKKTWRYYCDHCKKSGASGGHMKKHEAGCTNNPARVCSVCKIIGNEQRPMSELVQAAYSGSIDLKEVREMCDGCPMCILSAIRQCKRQHQPDGEDEGFWFKFDFKAERDEFWKNHNEALCGA